MPMHKYAERLDSIDPSREVMAVYIELMRLVVEMQDVVGR
jgi:hypothetical protein